MSRSGTALITGASSGIGEVYASALAARGFDLILIARREDRLESLANTLKQQHTIEVEILPGDLTNDEFLSSVEHVVATRDDLTLLINNAGFGTEGEFIDTPLELHIKMIDLHINATIRLIYSALPGMISRKNGTIINVSSTAGFPRPAGNPNYGATKAYLNSFSLSLQHEVKSHGIKVQAFCPGFTRTEFHSKSTMHGFDKSGFPAFLWMTPEKAVGISLKALPDKRVIVIPGWYNKLTVRIRGTGLMRFARSLLRSRSN